MDLEQPVQLHRRPVLHELPPAEDDGVVQAERHGRLLHCGHGRLARREAELLGFVPHDCLVAAGEERP